MPKMFRPFEEAMEFVWRWEGGFSNDPDDPGGATNYGITLQTARDNGLDIDGDGDIDVDDIKQMTPQAAYSVYKNKYWDAIDAGSLPWDLAIVAFDAAVNCGPGRARQWIEKALKDNNPVRAFNELRRIHYQTIISRNPVLSKYRNGWMNRVNDLLKLVDVLRVSVAEDTVIV